VDKINSIINISFSCSLSLTHSHSHSHSHSLSLSITFKLKKDAESQDRPSAERLEEIARLEVARWIDETMSFQVSVTVRDAIKVRVKVTDKDNKDVLIVSLNPQP
jgi:hypothetical protein